MNLLPGEKITIPTIDVTNRVANTEEAAAVKYEKGDIRIITEQARYPLSSILDMIDSGDYILNPEFQRRHRWNVLQKSRLIESFIINVPIPPIFLYEYEYSKYEVMDGLQRLTAIYGFFNNEYPLTDLEFWPEVNGLYYSELPPMISKGINRRYLSSIILLQETAKTEVQATQLKQLVFERINSGGVKLSAQESRNAIYNGSFNKLCIKLTRNSTFCRMWNIPNESNVEINEEYTHDKYEKDLLENDLYSTMGDVELILRFFAGRQRANLFKVGGNYTRFFDFYLKQANFFSPETIEELRKLFENTVNFVNDIFGDHAFYMYRIRQGTWNWYNRSTTAIYDPLMIVATSYIASKNEILSKHEKESIIDRLKLFYKDNYELFAGRNTNPGILDSREQKFHDLFKSLLA